LLGPADVQRVTHDHEPSVATATAPESVSAAASSKITSHVLIADANARTLAKRAEQLLAAGLRVSLAHTSFEAIVKASCHVPDFILLDGSLADLDAAATGQLLTTCPMTAHIPVFKLTPGRRVPQRVLAAALRHSPQTV
jgi:response regulator RpfG family c-di-GMP phosphodiesterase